MTATWAIRQGDALSVLQTMESGSVQCCVSSPPYFGLRSYSGGDAEIGLEPTPSEYVAKLVAVFDEVRRVLRDDGVLWLVIGDSYAGSWGNQGRKPERGSQRPINGPMLTPVHDGRFPATGSNTGKVPDGYKPKDLYGIPWRLAFALQDAGWWLRSDCIWSKPSAMPESVTDRPTRSHEYVFLLTKSARYFYDAVAIAEPSSGLTGGRFGAGGAEVGRLRHDAARERPSDTGTRNRRTVWTISPEPLGTVTEYADGTGAAYDHFAAYPTKLVEPCVLAGSRPGDTVLDPFCGSGTTGIVALRHGRRFAGIELNAQYVDLARTRIRNDAPMLNTLAEAGA